MPSIAQILEQRAVEVHSDGLSVDTDVAGGIVSLLAGLVVVDPGPVVLAVDPLDASHVAVRSCAEVIGLDHYTKEL